MSRLFKHLRLLPAVLVLGFGLFVVKGFDFARAASAEAEHAEEAPATEAAVPSDDSLGDDSAADDAEESSAAEVDVLTGLASRRAELDKRAEDLDMRENLIAAAEKRVEGKIADLKQLQGKLEGLLGKRDEAEQKQILALVKTYSLMKAKDAARIFNTLDEVVLLDVAQQMKPDVLGGILAGMQPAEAQKLTVKLANRLKLPEPKQAEAAPVQQVANLQPPAATPGTIAAPVPPATNAATTPAPTDAKAAEVKPAEAKAAPATAADTKPTDAKPENKPPAKSGG